MRKISADSDHMCPICILNGWNKKFLVIGSDSFQIVDEGMKKKILLGLVMGDFPTQMYVERKNLRNFAFDLVMGGKTPQM